MNEPDILKIIGAHKQIEIAKGKKNYPIDRLEQSARALPKTRGFAQALDRKIKHAPAIIAELKKASPSRGQIRDDFDPAALAQACEQGDAICLSVLIDERFFQGKEDYLTQARDACTLPVLCKDFFYDPWQVVRARALGADCILLIMRALDDAQAAELSATAQQWNMDVLPEIHDEKDLERALELNTKLIGINNRDLKKFTTDLAITRRLAPLVPQERLVICESGIAAREDIDLMLDISVRAFLVGESLMNKTDIPNALKKLMGVKNE